MKSTKRGAGVLGQFVHARHLDDAQVLAFGEDLDGALLVLRRGDDLDIALADQLGGGRVHRPVADHCAAHRGQPVGPVGALIRRRERVRLRHAAGVVVLQDRDARALRQELQDVQPVVHVGQVDFARMLSELEQVGFGERGDQPPARLDEPAFAEEEIAVDEFIEGRFLAGILSVAQALLDALAGILVRDFPGALAVDERLVAERNLHLGREMVVHDRAVRGLHVLGHDGNLRSGYNLPQRFSEPIRRANDCAAGA